MTRARALLATGAAGAGAGAVVLARRRAAARGVESPAQEPRAVAPPPPAGRTRTVLTDDGVALSVVEHGAQDEPAATVVLAHGYVQSSSLWAGQVRDLLDARPDLRVVTYDHRGHGRSGATTRDRATIAQLGRDLARVLEAVAPSGPVVVAGHSMGGMAVMALAEGHPDLFEDRVVGAAFVATAAGGLASATFGFPAPLAALLRRLLPVLHAQAVRAELRGKPRQVGPLDARVIFPRGADPALVRETLEVHRGCSAETVAAFWPTFSDHDRAQALSVLAHVPSLVVVGDRDVMCPVPHSRAIVAALPSSELVVYPGVGHMVHLERRPEVSRHLVELVDRAVPRAA